MLNISKTSIADKIDKRDYKSFQQIHFAKYSSSVLRVCYIILAIFVIVLFLPWTQNVGAKGYVTTLEPDKRPHEINSVIAGKIEKWYVKEGSYVKKGDTIIYLSEVKDDYFDPQLLDRTEEQIDAKASSVAAYKNKVIAVEQQVKALIETKELKIRQARNKLKQAYFKLQSDSIELEATKTNLKIAENQYARTTQLYEQGLKSLTDAEIKKAKLQEEQAKLIKNKNDLLKSENEILNARMEIISIETSYDEKIAKSNSDRFSTQSNQFDAEIHLSKYKNTYKNYQMRSGYHFVLAPQSGYISNITKFGIGEVFNAGDPIVTIMPDNYNLAIEMFVRPIDMPLLKVGNKTRIIFDGWPAVVFSGWPNVSFGTFGGEVVALDRFISPNGMYRVMVKQDSEDHPWPEQVSIGSGSKTISLLNTVPIWYEVWRQLNGFPPDYYEGKNSLKINVNSKEKK